MSKLLCLCAGSFTDKIVTVCVNIPTKTASRQLSYSAVNILGVISYEILTRDHLIKATTECVSCDASYCAINFEIEEDTSLNSEIRVSFSIALLFYQNDHIHLLKKPKTLS